MHLSLRLSGYSERNCVRKDIIERVPPVRGLKWCCKWGLKLHSLPSAELASHLSQPRLLLSPAETMDGVRIHASKIFASTHNQNCTAHSFRIHQGLRKGGHGQSGQVLPANAPLGARFYLCTRIAPRSRRIGNSPRTARPLGKAWWGQNLRGRRRPTGGQFEKALQSRTERSRDIRSTWEIACRSSDWGLYCLGMGSQWEMNLEEWIGLTVAGWPFIPWGS